MNTYATTGRPKWAVTAWVDSQSVFIEVPCKDGPPFITKYDLTENGLGKALTFMQVLHRKERPTGSRYHVEDHPKLAKVEVKGGDYSKDARAKTRDILKRMKIT